MIAFYGMGLLGSGFVRALRARGAPVRVWNRTPERARELAATGAVPVDDPAEAARGAERVHLTLTDDAAVDDVLERLRPGLSAGSVIVDHTTTSPSGARRRAARWAERGVEFLHAPVFMGPANALEGSGVMLASGDAARFERLRPALEPMTGKLVYLGAEAERAASMKLLGNTFLLFLTAGLSDFFALGDALGIARADAADLFRHWNPGLTLDARVARILGADFAHASWALETARKDARLMQEAAADGARELAFVPTIAAVMDRFIAAGHARDDWTVIAKDGR